MKNTYCYESIIIDNQAIMEFRESVEREIHLCTNAMKKMATKIQQLQMLDGFEGEAAESIKTYFSEVHLFLLEAIAEALTEFESMLNQYTMDILCNVDSSPYARISVSDLLGMRNQVKNKYLDMDETIDSVNELMNGIRDLIPMEPIQTERKAGGLGPIAIPKKEPLTCGYDYNDMLESSIHYGNCSSLLEDCEEIRSVLNQKAEMIDRITFDYAMDKLPIIQDYVEVLEGSLAEYSCVSRDMEGYQTGDYKKWETTSYLSDQMLLFSLYYTANQEEILAAKETLQQVSIEMHLAEEKEKKYDQIGAVKEVSSFGISLIPGLGDAKDLQEAIGGMDLITGKKLSALERVLAGACVIAPVVSGSMVRIAGKNADISEKISLLSEKQLFKKAGKGITMCEDAKKEIEQLIREVRNMLEEDADIKRLFAKNKNTGPQVEIAGVGKVSLEEAEKLVGKDARWSIGKSGNNTFKFSDMTESEIAKIVERYRKKAPIEIPDTAKYKAKSMADGYEQISYKWNDGTYKYEVRWHTRTSGAPEGQGNTWVIQRTIPGNGETKPSTQFLIGENEWVEGWKWYDAINARKNGTATHEQIELLDRGHWKE